MSYSGVLVHVATPVLRVEEGAIVEGERVVSETEGTPFACCLFLPLADDQPSPRGGRKVTRPTLLLAPDGPALSNEDELLISHPELNPWLGVAAGERVRWQVTGGVQPFGRPGSTPVGAQVTLARVDD